MTKKQQTPEPQTPGGRNERLDKVVRTRAEVAALLEQFTIRPEETIISKLLMIPDLSPEERRHISDVIRERLERLHKRG